MFSNIQMCRAYAAIIVFFHHASPHYEAMNGSSVLFKRISTWGFTGVDVFFVISGFVIAHTTLSKERSIVSSIEFLKHRLFRIYLGYWPFFIAAYLVTLVVLPDKLDSISILDSFLLTSTNMNELILPVSWSLCYELYFYAIFAFFFTVRVEIVKIILPVLFVAMILRSIYITINIDSPLAFLFSDFLIEFLSGTILYIYRSKLKNRWLIPLGISLAVAAFSYGIHIDAKNCPYRVFTFGLASFAIVMTMLTLEECGIYRAKKYITAFGDSSYTLYLSHLGLLQLFYFAGIRTFFSSQGQWLVEFGFAIFILFCLIISHIFYLKIELPIYKMSCRINFRPMWLSIITKS